MRPAADVTVDLLVREIAMFDFDTRAIAFRDQPYLDAARTWGQVLGAGVAPADEEPVRRVELEVAAAHRRAAYVEGEASVGSGSSRAYSPIQRTIASGRVKYSYTRSGGASTNTEAVTGSVVIALVGLDDLFEAFEARGPQLGEQLADRLEPLGAYRIQAPLTLRADGHEACILEHLQVLGDGLLADVEARGDLVDRVRVVADEHEDRYSARLGERSQRGFGTHALHNTIACLYKLKRCIIEIRSDPEETVMTSDLALPVVRRYHLGWTSRNYEQAIGLLAPTLKVEVPINDYPTAESFAHALRGFGNLVTNVVLLSEMSAGDEAMLLYDMHVQQLGTLRVVEHFTVSDGKIARLRQVHDTAPIRAAGAAPTPMTA